MKKIIILILLVVILGCAYNVSAGSNPIMDTCNGGEVGEGCVYKTFLNDIRNNVTGNEPVFGFPCQGGEVCIIGVDG